MSYIDNVVIKLPIYFNSYMRIFLQIIDMICKLFHVFIQNGSVYKY